MKYTEEQLKKAANTIRCLSADMIEKANSGHPGAPLGMADLAVSLWLNFLNFDPKETKWPNRDRLVFSGGHASALVYSLFHLAGVGNLSINEVQEFRQFGSRCAGHPERGVMPGVEVTTGPLGQGIAMAVGLALAERMEAARFGDEICSHRTWCFCGDGDLMEGISHEACSLAGRLALDRLVLVYDSNGITIEGSTDLAVADDAKKRFESYGWKVYECDGHDFAAIDRTYRKALRTERQPTLIIAKTHIGFGAPGKQDTAGVHGAPLGAEALAGLKSALGFDPAASFAVEQDVYDLFASRSAAMHRLFLRWKKTFAEWEKSNPEKAAARNAAYSNVLPKDIASKLPAFDPAKPVATRNACGDVMNALAAEVPYLVGGSADLAPSNKTYLKDAGDIAPGSYSGRNFHFGIRELAMTAIVNGITAHGGWRAYGATFAVFSDYCKPALRLAALMKTPSIFVFSHDSFYVGEDGPTHEPIEQLASLRSMPNVRTWRPADARETGFAWLEMLRRTDGPSCIFTSRQNLPVLEEANADGLARGGYILFGNAPMPELVFIASGSEVSIALDAAKTLASEGKLVRVVSMPSLELFLKQSEGYRDGVIPPDCKRRVIVEAGVRFGWDRFIVDQEFTRFITMENFGASGPYKTLAERFGFTAARVLSTAREIL